MKEGWQITSVGQLIQPIETTNPTKEPEKEFSYVDVSGVNSRSLSIEDVNTLLGKEAPSRARRRIRKDDVLFATVRPTLRRVAIVPTPLNNQVCSTGYMVLRSGNQVLPKYLFYYVASDRFIDQMAILERGASYPAVSDADVRGAAIPLPPLEEQQAIVDILDEAFAGLEKARANAEANLESAEELFQSYLDEAMNRSGPANPLRDYIEISHGYAFKGPTFENSNDSSLPIIITPGNFTKTGQLSFTQRNTKRLIQEAEGGDYFNNGDMVVVMTDLSSKMPLLGRPAFIEASNILHNQRIGRVSFKTDVLSQKFAFYFMQSTSYLSKIRGSASGTMVRHTSPKKILDISLPLPDRAKQRDIVDKLDNLKAETGRLQEEYKRQLSDLDELKQSLLQKAFAGELT